MFGRASDRLRVSHCVSGRAGSALGGCARTFRRGAHRVRGRRHRRGAPAYLFQDCPGLSFNRVSHIGQRGSLLGLRALALLFLLHLQTPYGQGVVFKYHDRSGHLPEFIVSFGISDGDLQRPFREIVHHRSERADGAGKRAKRRSARRAALRCQSRLRPPGG